jgi:lipopolysaccharide transport system ATP-binding protein
MSDVVLRAEGLGKSYRLTHQPASYRTLQEDLLGLPRRLWAALRPAPRETFWALRDASLEVRAGEVLGIIGRNGSGKSTLLKILSRITEPTTGYVEVSGRVGSLLEVGTGFHPELTGRENIFLSGAVLGMKRVEIQRRFDEIVAFADVEKFLDTPAKHFSSGMYMRLAFSVAAHLEPDILLLDEVLAVGDAEFQKKCLGVMEGIVGSGRTVLFVSHNLGVVESLCTRTILLEKGRITSEGVSRQVVARYLSSVSSDPMPLSQRRDRRGDGRLRFGNLEVLAQGGPHSGKELRLRMHYGVCSDAGPLRNVSFAISINNLGGGYLLLFSTEGTQHNVERIEGDGWIECAIPFLPLAAGSYGLNVFAAVNGIVADNVVNAVTLSVNDSEFCGAGSRNPEHPPFIAAHCWSEGP